MSKLNIENNTQLILQNHYDEAQQLKIIAMQF